MIKKIKFPQINYAKPKTAPYLQSTHIFVNIFKLKKLKRI